MQPGRDHASRHDRRDDRLPDCGNDRNHQALGETWDDREVRTEGSHDHSDRLRDAVGLGKYAIDGVVLEVRHAVEAAGADRSLDTPLDWLEDLDMRTCGGADGVPVPLALDLPLLQVGHSTRIHTAKVTKHAAFASAAAGAADTGQLSTCCRDGDR